jgi:dynein light chain 1
MSVGPPTTVKEAISRFEKEEFDRRMHDETARAEFEGREKKEIPPVVASQEKYVKLLGMLPPITKMDKEITTLTACEQLGLSTNAIEKIGPGMKELKNLRILSLGRNAIRKLEQLEVPQLEQLWISYNKIDKLSGLDKLKNLKVLYMSNNQIAAWSEIDRLANQCPELTDVLFINNPIHTNSPTEKEYRLMMLQRLPKLVKLDGVPVEPDEREEADARRNAS